LIWREARKRACSEDSALKFLTCYSHIIILNSR
jgi:hypothetical protein